MRVYFREARVSVFLYLGWSFAMGGVGGERFEGLRVTNYELEKGDRPSDEKHDECDPRFFFTQFQQEIDQPMKKVPRIARRIFSIMLCINLIFCSFCVLFL